MASKMARDSDPSSSHEAAEEHEGSGRAESQRVMCLERCISDPGLHSRAYDKLMGVSECARKRFPELRELGLVESDIRYADDLNRNVLHWFPTGEKTWKS